jgi:hypothetical protein
MNKQDYTFVVQWLVYVHLPNVLAKRSHRGAGGGGGAGGGNGEVWSPTFHEDNFVIFSKLMRNWGPGLTL